MDRSRLRVVFKYINTFFMVPAFRLGLAPLLVNPLTGYIMVLTTTGRRSGKQRDAPINYAMIDGCVYCMAGWGRKTHWFVNLKANPTVEVRLPGATMVGLAEEVIDPEEARQALLQVCRNAGFAPVFDGLNPLTLTDGEVLATYGTLPVVRIRPTAFIGGSYDPKGHAWLWPLLALLFWLVGHRLSRKGHEGLRSPRRSVDQGVQP